MGVLHKILGHFTGQSMRLDEFSGGLPATLSISRAVDEGVVYDSSPFAR
jgi:hypothetical protein